MFERNIQALGLYEEAQIVFLIVALVLFGINHALRLYLIPRAEESRVQDFLSSAHNVKLTQDTTEKYYNNDETDPYRRSALQLLENLFFTKNVSAEMLKATRIICALYLLSWLGLVFCRDVSLGWIFVASQVLFSEEVFSKYLRLEWLRNRTGRLYEDVYRLFQTSINKKDFEIQTLEKFIIYEKIKAGLAVTLSSKIFNKRNDDLSTEWEKICKPLQGAKGTK